MDGPMYPSLNGDEAHLLLHAPNEGTDSGVSRSSGHDRLDRQRESQMLPHRSLIDEGTIRRRVGELAEIIAADLPSRQPILLGLLTGSFVFLADLARELSRHGVEPKVDFLIVSHYGPSTDPTRASQIEKDARLDLSEQAVLVVDDIVDSGVSLAAVLEHLAHRKPSWLRTCVFLDKPSRRILPMKADYVGFEVPDVWFIGYGLDLGGEGRALPYIAAVENGAVSGSPGCFSSQGGKVKAIEDHGLGTENSRGVRGASR